MDDLERLNEVARRSAESPAEALVSAASDVPADRLDRASERVQRAGSESGFDPAPLNARVDTREKGERR
jgi:hypothetical protein